MSARQLLEARSDLGAFARLVDRPLTDWQADSLRLERRITVVVAPRQGGKSRSLAVLALHRAFRLAGQHVLIVSAGEDAARRLLAEVRTIAALSPLLSGSVVDEQSSLVTLSNGSQIRSVPASERQIRGWSVDLLLIDEAGWVEDDLILGAAIPTTAARPDARIVLASSAGEASGAFYDHFVQGEAGSPHVQSFRWRLEDCTWISRAVLEAARASLPPKLFAAEYEGVFADSLSDPLIEREWIEVAQRRTFRPGACSGYGADIARGGGDETVVMAARGEPGGPWVLRLAHLEPDVEAAWRGVTLDVTTDRLARMVGRHNGGVPMVVDMVGLGAGVHDELVARDLHVMGFSGGERAHRSERYVNRRAEVFWELRELLRTELVDLDPADRVLARQLGSLSWSTDGKGRRLIGSKQAMRAGGVASPDRADAGVMALAAAPLGPRESEADRLLRTARDRDRSPMAGVLTTEY